jgi:hypothetical protein
MVDETATVLLAKAIELVAVHPTHRSVMATAIYAALGWDWQRQQPNAYRLAAALEADGLIWYTRKRNDLMIHPTKKGVNWVQGGPLL